MQKLQKIRNSIRRRMRGPDDKPAATPAAASSTPAATSTPAAAAATTPAATAAPAGMSTPAARSTPAAASSPAAGATTTPAAAATTTPAAAATTTPATNPALAAAALPAGAMSTPAAPAAGGAAPMDARAVATAATTPATTELAANVGLSVYLRNHTLSSQVYAYVTGSDINRGGALFLLESNGATGYYPASPSGTGQPLQANIAIQLPPPGQTRQITLPTYLAGARVWFSVDSQLTFKLNPGPSLVEPSVTNSADPNIHKKWDFCEFTYNSAQLFANISYVDFVSMPIALTLYPTSGNPQHVSGIDENGLGTIVRLLNEQHARDGADWNELVVNLNGGPLRVLSPNSAVAANGGVFPVYFQDYINQVWAKYAAQGLTINTQASYGAVTGRVENNVLQFAGASFVRPNTRDVFSNSTGPFQVTSGVNVPIVPRLAAAFNRSTLLYDTVQPDGSTVGQYYSTSPTNHYSRICHAVNLDHKGYAFPYDDVTPDGQPDQAGTVSGQARVWIIAVGGHGAGLGPAPLNI